MLPEILTALSLAVILIFITVKKRAFTLSAALTAGVILLTAAICGGFGGIFIVLGSYAVIFTVDLIFGKKTKSATSQISNKSGARDVAQVIVNFAVAVIAIILGKILSNEIFLVAYAVSLTECLADSLASDVGVLSQKDPIDICRMKRIKRGLSGGVSLLGTVSALLGCVAMSLISMIFWGFDLKYFLAILAVPMIGILIDSVLGSLVQAKYQCTECGKFTEKAVHCGKPTRHSGGLRIINNDAVNIISNFSSAAIAALFLLL
jgi:uncharacterized protein (TIGR00297 family)